MNYHGYLGSDHVELTWGINNESKVNPLKSTLYSHRMELWSLQWSSCRSHFSAYDQIIQHSGTRCFRYLLILQLSNNVEECWLQYKSDNILTLMISKLIMSWLSVLCSTKLNGLYKFWELGSVIYIYFNFITESMVHFMIYLLWWQSKLLLPVLELLAVW